MSTETGGIDMKTDRGIVHWFGADGTQTTETDVAMPSIERMELYLDGLTEHVTVLFNRKRCSMYVHEFGRRLWTARNPAATEIYFAAARARGIDPENKEQARQQIEAMADRMGVSHENITYMENPETAKPPGIYGPAILLEDFKP